MQIVKYNRNLVVEYAKKWAYYRNPQFYNFDLIGGDCTNFVSQCIYSGCGVMNYNKINGWYYNSINDRSPSWTGVEFLYNFLIENSGAGPFGKQVQQNKIEIGDVIQLSFDGQIYKHNLIVVNAENVNSLSTIKIASHTDDSFNRSVSTYNYKLIRFIHIEAVRK